MKTTAILLITLLPFVPTQSFAQEAKDGAPSVSKPLHLAHYDRSERRERGERGGHMRGQKGGHKGGMRALEALLEQYDTDGDAALSQAELSEARAAQLRTHDADGNGTLNLEEYQALWLEAMREQMVDRFQRHDDDGNGEVTVEEFNEDFARLIERRDRNNDGVLNSEDLRRPERGRSERD